MVTRSVVAGIVEFSMAATQSIACRGARPDILEYGETTGGRRVADERARAGIEEEEFR